jgi:hypothetical protein
VLVARWQNEKIGICKGHTHKLSLSFVKDRRSWILVTNSVTCWLSGKSLAEFSIIRDFSNYRVNEYTIAFLQCCHMFTDFFAIPRFSCPKVNGCFMGKCPQYVWRSDPQIAALVSRTIASRGSMIFGTSTSLTLMEKAFPFH